MKLKKLKPGTPARSSSALTTRFGGVPISVVMPLIRAAALIGIIRRLGPIAGAFGDSERYRNEDRRDRRRAHDCAESADDEHQEGYQPRLAPAGPHNQPVPDPLRDPGAHEAVADHEQRGDQHDVRVAEAGKRFAHRHDAGQRKRDQHDQRDGVEPRLVDREHDDRGRKQRENEDERGHEGGPASRGSAHKG